MTLHVCAPGYERFLAKELPGPAEKIGHGWVLGPDGGGELCFAHYSLMNVLEAGGKSVNAIAWAIADRFMETAREERFDAPWPLLIESAGVDGLNRRAKSVVEECAARIKGRMSRVGKLAAPGRPAPGKARGLFAYMTGFDSAHVSRVAFFGGQRRMADDPQAPSRSYLKAEEAYLILGREPAAGETVADLGAAPGGWSYSAARRGALVTAVDNGPMKSGGLHPGIIHHEEDAFTFRPESPRDWLFCDMVEDPERIVALVDRWLKEGWAKRFVVNLKFGRVDPIPLLRKIELIRRHCGTFKARHLFHDREEFTIVGERR